MRSRESSYHQHCSHKYRNNHQSNQRNCDNRQPDYHHQDSRHHDCGQCNDKDRKSNTSYNKKDDCKCNYSKKKSNEAMHNDQSSLSSAGNLSGRRSQSRSRSPSHSCSWSRSCSSCRSNDSHHVNQDDHKPSAAPKRRYSYSKDNDDGHYYRPDKSNTVFATFSTPKAKNRNMELCQ